MIRAIFKKGNDSILRIALYGLNYSPELTGIGKYSGEMVEWLAQRGHEVRVVTAPPYYPAWRVRDDYSWWQYRKEANSDGSVVYRCPVWVPRRQSGMKRVLHLMSFAVSSLPVMAAMTLWRPEVVFTVQPSTFCSPAALLVGSISQSLKWLHIQDLEVDAAFDLGLLPAGGRLHRLALAGERALLQKFDRVSSISPKMLQRARKKGTRADQAILFPNWVDTDFIYPLEDPTKLRAQLGIPRDKIVLLYSGNMGTKQGLDMIVSLAKNMRNDSRVHFVFCGDGAFRPQIEKLITDLRNVSLLPLQPIERLNDLLNAADIHLLPQSPDAADLVMPSKLTGMLASGRPVIAVAPAGTQIAEVVAGKGIVFPRSDVQ